MSAPEARRLMRHARTGALATSVTNREGWPLASLVATACDIDVSPILLMSRLAMHTRNLEADPRACLLFTETGRAADPLAAARVSVVGRIRKTGDVSRRQRFLAWHPAAERYADFADFAFYRMDIDGAHFVGGFGRIHHIRAKDLLFPAPADDDTVADYARRVEHLQAVDPGFGDRLAATMGRQGRGWNIASVDAEGCALRRAKTAIRVDFAFLASVAPELFRIIDLSSPSPRQKNLE